MMYVYGSLRALQMEYIAFFNNLHHKQAAE